MSLNTYECTHVLLARELIVYKVKTFVYSDREEAHYLINIIGDTFHGMRVNVLALL